MTIGLICNRDTVIARRDDAISTVARLMRVHHVGSVVVVEDAPEGIKPVGIVTDRDLVVEILAAEVDAQTVTAGDVMTHELVSAREHDGIWVTLKRMRNQGIRRLPVVDDRGVLIGLVSADDLLDLLAGELTDLVRLTGREREREILKRNG